MTADGALPLDGVLLVAKPAGQTSFDVVRRVKKLLPRTKVGHTGTLDPMATGLLPLAVGEATKLTRWLSGGDKRYRARLQLGTATDTLDATGRPAEQAAVPELDAAAVEAALAPFRGTIGQVPPMYSAVHHRGQRLYALARQGLEVERRPRPVAIHRLELVALEPAALELDVLCSAGTYIRSLADDIARALGTVGHLSALERTEVCGWHLERALPLAQLDQATTRDHLLSLEQVLTRFDRIDVTAGIARRLANGQRLERADLGRLGVAPADSPRTVWFMPPDAAPIVLAELAPDGAEPAMRILRVLRPPRGGGPKNS
jgi:tRNA pseudouridine55 synthase